MIAGGSADARADVRVNLFMAATLHAAATETGVKIRDLSASGARIESPVIPAVGSPIMLSRGSLSVRGRVAWRNGQRCGIQFAATISVRAWMANPVNREQERIDSVVTAIKAGVEPPMTATTAGAATAEGLPQDLARVTLLLEKLGDALTDDPAVIARHGVALQNLDIAMQILAALGETMDAGRGGAGVARLEDLRKSCQQALGNTD
ncbi:MAG: PilZ domain-containing protein [Sphingomicrobium sp.]